jgi:hypothetical protein
MAIEHANECLRRYPAPQTPQSSDPNGRRAAQLAAWRRLWEILLTPDPASFDGGDSATPTPLAPTASGRTLAPPLSDVPGDRTECGSAVDLLPEEHGVLP